MSRFLSVPLRRLDHSWGGSRLVLPTSRISLSSFAVARSDIKEWRPNINRLSLKHGIVLPHRKASTSAVDGTELQQTPGQAEPKSAGLLRSLIWANLGFVALCIAGDYFFPVWFDYRVVAKETFSPSMSIITIQKATPDANWLQKIWRTRSLADDTRQLQRLWEMGIWTLMLTDYMDYRPRLHGNVASYTPLPPLEGQEPNQLRILVHMEEKDDVATRLVNEKASKEGAYLRMALQPGSWMKSHAIIQPHFQQVVIYATGPTGIAPMLQTIHTLLEARNDQEDDNYYLAFPGVTNVRVVWLGQIPRPADSEGEEGQIYRSLTPPFNDSTADEVASRELERMRQIHPDRLSIESVDPERMFKDGPEVRKLTRGSPKLLVISGPKSLSRYLSGHKEGLVQDEDGTNIIKRANRAGWAVLDLSTKKVCN